MTKTIITMTGRKKQYRYAEILSRGNLNHLGCSGNSWTGGCL